MEVPTLEQVDVPSRKLQLMESLCRSRLLEGAVASGEEPRKELDFCQILWGTHAGAVHSWRPVHHGKELCLSTSWRPAANGKDPCWRGLWGDYILWGDPTLEQENNVSRKEQQRRRVVNWLQPPFPTPLCCSVSGGGGGGKVGSEVELGKKQEGWGEGEFSFVLFLAS